MIIYALMFVALLSGVNLGWALRARLIDGQWKWNFIVSGIVSLFAAVADLAIR